MKTTHSEAQHWWSNLSTGERRLICATARMLKGASSHGPRLCRRPAAATSHRRNRPLLKDLIRAISNWERGIGCFIKIRIIHQCPFRLAPHDPWLRIEGKRPAQLKKPAKSMTLINTSLQRGVSPSDGTFNCFNSFRGRTSSDLTI
jgi:hypothetical protein